MNGVPGFRQFAGFRAGDSTGDSGGFGVEDGVPDCWWMVHWLHRREAFAMEWEERTEVLDYFLPDGGAVFGDGEGVEEVVACLEKEMWDGYVLAVNHQVPRKDFIESGWA